jgi:hypothetical protein
MQRSNRSSVRSDVFHCWSELVDDNDGKGLEQTELIRESTSETFLLGLIEASSWWNIRFWCGCLTSPILAMKRQAKSPSFTREIARISSDEKIQKTSFGQISTIWTINTRSHPTVDVALPHTRRTSKPSIQCRHRTGEKLNTWRCRPHCLWRFSNGT